MTIKAELIQKGIKGFLEKAVVAEAQALALAEGGERDAGMKNAWESFDRAVHWEEKGEPTPETLAFRAKQEAAAAPAAN